MQPNMQPNLNAFCRISGVIQIVAGALLAVAYLTHHHHMTPETISSSHWFWVHLAFVGSLLGGIFGAMGLYFGHVERLGIVGHTGFALAICGLFLIGGLAYFEVFMAPTIAREFPALIETYGAADTMGPVAILFPVSGTLTVAGYALLAGALRPVSDLSSRALMGLLVTAVIFGFGLSPLGGLHAAMVGGTLFGGALIWVGLGMAGGGDVAEGAS